MKTVKKTDSDYLEHNNVSWKPTNSKQYITLHPEMEPAIKPSLQKYIEETDSSLK